ncbi:MAG TPA: hypothetical protein VGB38_00670, partial [bacterium]
MLAAFFKKIIQGVRKALKAASSWIAGIFRAVIAWIKKLAPKTRNLIIAGLIIVAAGAAILALLLQPEGLEVHAVPPDLKQFEKDAKIPPMSLAFSGSAAKIELVDKSIDTGIKISPEIPGTWIWSDDQTITFFPLADWEPGREYQVSMEESIFSPKVKIKTNKVA